MDSSSTLTCRKHVRWFIRSFVCTSTATAHATASPNRQPIGHACTFTCTLTLPPPQTVHLLLLLLANSYVQDASIRTPSSCSKPRFFRLYWYLLWLSTSLSDSPSPSPSRPCPCRRHRRLLGAFRFSLLPRCSAPCLLRSIGNASSRLPPPRCSAADLSKLSSTFLHSLVFQIAH